MGEDSITIADDFYHPRGRRLDLGVRQDFNIAVSIAEKIFEKAKARPEPAQATLLELAEVLTTKNADDVVPTSPRFGSAKGLIKIGPEFDEPLEDFRPYVA